MASGTLGIYPIDLKILQNQNYLAQHIYPDSSKEYYWSRDFSPAFYIAQAKAGFIAIAEEINGEELLLPEIQSSYAVLYFDHLHIAKKVSTILQRENPVLHLSSALDTVAAQIERYHRDNWLSSRYLQILKDTQDTDPTFRVFSAFLEAEGRVIAGEIGYTIGRTYTSLTGFSSREKRYRNYGKVQMVLLAQWLQKQGVSLWNLGHPYMPYKTALGAKIYTRAAFLHRWKKEIAKDPLSFSDH